MLLEITVAIIFAKLLNVLLEKLKQPGVIGEILAGIILGPCVIGALSGSSVNLFGSSIFQFNLNLTSPEFKEIAFIGVIFLLFIVGLETNLDDLKKTRKAGTFAGIFGVIVPFFIGCFVGLLFNMTVIQSMALGAIFLATSATIAIRILADMDMLATRVGLTLHTAVVINDILAMIVFTLVFGTSNSVILLLQILLFFILTIGIGILLVRYTLKKNATRKAPVVLLTTGLVICFLFAAFAENMGITAIIGAFIAGLFIRKTPQAGTLSDYIKTIGYAFFIPIFFVWVGASFDFFYLIESQQMYTLIFFIIIFILAALVGNFLGGSIGSRLSGLTRRESISVGIGMMPVMGVALIIVSTGVDKGIFGDPSGVLAQKIKIATLLLIITSSIITPPILKKSMASPFLKQLDKSKTKLASYSQPHCPSCDSSIRYVPDTNKWYCDTCQKFLKQYEKIPANTSQRKKRKIDKYIEYVIGAGTILMCGLAIQSLENTSLSEKISAVVGIFIGTTLAFFTVKYFFIKKDSDLASYE